MRPLILGLFALAVIALASTATQAATPHDVASVAAATTVAHPWGPRVHYGPRVYPHVYRPAVVVPAPIYPVAPYPPVYRPYRSYYYGYGTPYYAPGGGVQVYGPGGGISIGW